MRKVKRLVAVFLITVCVIFIGTISALAARVVVNPANLKTPPPGNGGALRMAELVNEERVRHGLRPVKFYSFAPVQKAARIRAGEIRDKFDHVRPDSSVWHSVLDGLQIDYRVAGENIGHGSGMKPEAVMQMWMNSPEHRANILNPDYNMLGVGCAYAPFLNVTNWVQIFLQTNDGNKDFVELLPQYAEDIKSLPLFPGVDIDGIIAKNMNYLSDSASKIAAGDKSVKQYMTFGHASKFLGDKLGARDSFQKALELDPSNVAAYVAIADTYDFPYDMQKLTWLQKGEALGIRNSDLYASLARVYNKLNQDEKALYYANMAVEVNPESSLAQSVRKNVLEYQEFKRKKQQ